MKRTKPLITTLDEGAPEGVTALGNEQLGRVVGGMAARGAWRTTMAMLSSNGNMAIAYDLGH